MGNAIIKSSHVQQASEEKTCTCIQTLRLLSIIFREYWGIWGGGGGGLLGLSLPQPLPPPKKKKSHQPSFWAKFCWIPWWAPPPPPPPTSMVGGGGYITEYNTEPHENVQIGLKSNQILIPFKLTGLSFLCHFYVVLPDTINEPMKLIYSRPSQSLTLNFRWTAQQSVTCICALTITTAIDRESHYLYSWNLMISMWFRRIILCICLLFGEVKLSDLPTVVVCLN